MRSEVELRLEMRRFLPIFLLSLPIAGGVTAAPLKRYEKPISPSIIYFGEPRAREIAQTTQAGSAEEVVPFRQPLSFDPPPELAGDQKRNPGDAGGEFTSVSPSIVAIDPLHLDIDLSQFAAIGDNGKPRMRDPHLPPMVIRGGLYGDAFARGMGEPQNAEAKPEAAPAGKQAATTSEPPAAGDNEPTKQAAPEVTPPPPPPTAKME